MEQIKLSRWYVRQTKCFFIIFRAKFQDVVFIYISDDLDWGKRNVIKTAKLRNIAIYLAADDTKEKERNRNRNRFVCSLSVAKEALYCRLKDKCSTNLLF